MESATFVELKTAQALAVLMLFAPSKSTKRYFSTIIRYFAIREFLLILSKFNLQYINKSVCEFYMLFMILRMAIKKTHNQKNQKKTDSEEIPKNKNGNISELKKRNNPRQHFRTKFKNNDDSFGVLFGNLFSDLSSEKVWRTDFG